MAIPASPSRICDANFGLATIFAANVSAVHLSVGCVRILRLLYLHRLNYDKSEGLSKLNLLVVKHQSIWGKEEGGVIY